MPSPDSKQGVQKLSLPVSGDGLFALNERQQRIIEDQLEVALRPGENELEIVGDQDSLAIAVNLLRFVFSPENNFSDNELKYYLRLLKQRPDFDLVSLLGETVRVSRQGKIVQARGEGQLALLKAFRSHEIVFGIGPAGTGKTWLATAWAVSSVLKGEANKIVLVRPVVEAGENLGFLPGDLTEKINPYLRPLYDAIYEMLGRDDSQQWFEKGLIEIAPLAYMRGRTLANSIIILDEAQNTTKSQMKMFLTRIGPNSQAIITGDITQTDLPSRSACGLIHARDILREIAGIRFVELKESDIIRHRLIQEIITAYSQDETKKTKDRDHGQ